LCKLIHKTIIKQQAHYIPKAGESRKERKWRNCSLRYFKKHITIEKLMQICMLVYLFNFEAEKKNLSVLLGKVVKGQGEKQAMETHMYSWLQNLAGLKGNFLLAQLPNTDYWYDESLRESKHLGGSNGKQKQKESQENNPAQTEDQSDAEKDPEARLDAIAGAAEGDAHAEVPDSMAETED
jgi:hypothetical protein